MAKGNFMFYMVIGNTMYHVQPYFWCNFEGGTWVNYHMRKHIGFFSNQVHKWLLKGLLVHWKQDGKFYSIGLTHLWDMLQTSSLFIYLYTICVSFTTTISICNG